MEKDSHVRIFLDSIEVSLKIGLCDHEQNVPQRVIVDVAAYVDAKTYLKTVTPESIVDYAVFYNAIKGWEERAQVLLIEDYLKELVDLSFEHKGVQGCELRVRKADIFGADQGAGIEVSMCREDWTKS